MTWFGLVSVVAIAAASAGCVGDPTNEGAANEERVEVLAVAARTAGSCDETVCGTSNSPEIDNLGIHDLDMTGAEANAEGFRVTSFQKNGREYGISVAQATLTGLDKTGAVALSGGNAASATSLIGAELRVHNDITQTEYAIRIDGVDNAPYWARPSGVQQVTPTYLVTWNTVKNGRPSSEWKNICSHPPADNTDTLGMNRFHVVLFEEDRISTRTKVVYARDKYWFNIGCAAHAVSKLHLSGLTEGAHHAYPQLFSSSLDERTTFLKMLAADYCGNGHAFTVAGQPLNWRDHRGWMNYALPGARLEARWTPTGASCLNTPRVLANPTPAGRAALPDVMLAIKQTCKLPPSCGAPESELMGAFDLSANP